MDLINGNVETFVKNWQLKIKQTLHSKKNIKEKISTVMIIKDLND